MRRIASIAAVALSAVVFGVIGCGGPVESFDEVSAAARLVDGTPEADAVLALLNAATTTVEVLDIDARLDVRAARNLIARRNGPDGVFGTADDRPFSTIAEVDAVKYVGPKALARLLQHADEQGLITADDDLGGRFDGVTFTHEEAQAVLRLVNTADRAALDDDLGLDRRAVDAIFAARPIATVEVLAGLYYVGTKALTILKAGATVGAAALCASPSDCASGLQCIGRPIDRSGSTGVCRNTNPIQGQGDRCLHDRECDEATVCVDTVGGGNGTCMPAWMRGAFVHADRVTIPNTGAVARDVVVSGLANRPLDVAVRLDLDHTHPEDLLITLTDPNRRMVIVSDRDITARRDRIFIRGLPRTDAANGRWTLSIRDLGRNGAGALAGWTLELNSEW